MNEFDQIRLQRNVAAVRSMLNWVTNQPHLDLPESHPTPIEMPDAVKHAKVESESCNLALDLCHVEEIELLNCVSGRDPAGCNEFDEARLRSVLEKLDKLVTDHVATATPLDLPETIPSEPMAPPGQMGQNP